MSSPSRPLDRRRPLVLDTHDLGRRAGAMKELSTVTEAPEGIGDVVIGVATASPVRLELRLESVVEGVLVTGAVAVTVTGQCGRCLEPLEEPLEVDVQELYLYPDAEPDDTEASRMEGELLDLEPLVRDEVVLELPFMPLCREDCEGLCPDCGVNLNLDPEHGHEQAIDPRWGDLAGWQGEQS